MNGSKIGFVDSLGVIIDKHINFMVRVVLVKQYGGKREHFR